MADSLAKFADRMRQLPARLSPKLAAAVAQSLRSATLWGYAHRVDVNGKTYKPAKDGHLPQMLRSRALRNSVSASPVRRGGAWGGAVRTDVPYDEFLRGGTPKMEAREHLPSPGQTPPLRYQQYLDANVPPVLKAEVDRVCR